MELSYHQRALVRDLDRPFEDITREEKLWYLRTHLEGEHRGHQFLMCAWRTYDPPIELPLPRIPGYQFQDIYNKSVPIYILKGHWWLAGILDNYIYRRWFKPYRSEIEYGRFITKFIGLRDTDTPCAATLQRIVSLNGAVCAQIHELRKEYDRVIAGESARRLDIVKDHHHYVLQPLFQALLLVLNPTDWHGEDSSSIGRIPVILVRTGVEDGLSEPITFESIVDKTDGYVGENAIRTTVETAIGFVMDLEARETRAFGLRPDQTASWDPDALFDGWREIMPFDQLIGPSSRFVDDERYPEWSGPGHFFDTVHCVQNEQRELRRYASWFLVTYRGTSTNRDSDAQTCISGAVSPPGSQLTAACVVITSTPLGKNYILLVCSTRNTTSPGWEIRLNPEVRTSTRM
ncbi:hypothetical protein BBK36DRAFT_1167806 [Trichoderma citrinoviride]|uniref:Uncharacterized protein n=1 Tax=Trichoderma citrinoviride TaxID=58853 RepID=A0A2T4BDY9_9HYPO|nr:hypothetical protein BBK36DRAFT_1167806 [Trichoderma citrinoviride]PTB67409.1 hypothetical protein BBK36DRAFT_1167806 [Trichoderma citrinoviride]